MIQLLLHAVSRLFRLRDGGNGHELISEDAARALRAVRMIEAIASPVVFAEWRE